MKKILLILFFLSLSSSLFAGNITVTSGSSDNLKVTDGDTIVINGKKIYVSNSKDLTMIDNTPKPKDFSFLFAACGRASERRAQTH